MDLPLIWVLKLFASLSRLFNLGSGSTWPGHIMLGINPSFLKAFDKKFPGKVIVIAGTNGKTTTSKLIRIILEESGQEVMHNEAGANLLNGVASAIIDGTNWSGSEKDAAIFEIDENSLPLLVKEITPDILVVLNLFRDQLDRYGEVNTIALKWKKAFRSLPQSITVILNANDPEIAFLGKDLEKYSSRYFGLYNKNLYLTKRPHAMDSVNCPSCGQRLLFEGIYLGHLGNWKCSNCSFEEPSLDYAKEDAVLPGIYNIYNTQAAALVAKTLGIDNRVVEGALKNFSPSFGRQEKFVVDGKLVKIFLSKNPTGFNESLRTVRELDAKYLLLVLNDRIPDGRDVSWIWDVDFEDYLDNFDHITMSGDRCYDMALRIKYANPSKVKSEKLKVKSDNAKFKIHENLKTAIDQALDQTSKEETLYILPTYSAMLEVRKILGGRKIL